jgi:hypothetical protein
MSDERRAFQRLNLTEPVDGAFGGVPLRIVEVSARGVLALVDEELQPGARGGIHFHWRGEDVDAAAAVVWCEEGRAGFRLDDVPELLRRLIEESVTELLRAQEANAAGDRHANVIDFDDTLTAASTRFPVADVFVTYTVRDGAWTRRTSLLPDQPPDGFTVWQSEPAEHVELLCRTFEHGDAETRRLTRLFAELSVTRLPLVR